MRLIRPGKAVVCAGLSFALALSPLASTVAAAVTNEAIESTSAELETARAHLSELSAQCEQKFAELEDQHAELEGTRQKISDTEGQIEIKEQELVDARAVLAENVAVTYKNGTDFLSFLFGSTSLDDLVSRVYYADKVSSHQAEAVSTVLTIQKELDAQKATLESEKSQQEKLVAQAETTARELQAVVSEQQSYVNGLDAQLQAEIAAQEEAERQAAEEQARKEAEERAAREAELAAQSNNNATPTANNGNNTTTNTNTNNGSTASTTSNTKKTNTSSSSSSSSTRTVGNYGSGVAAAIEYAKSQVGVSYSWSGNAIANQEFDCSGLVWWAYQQAGISIPRGQRLSNGRGSSMIGWCLDGGGWTTSQANLQPGDLMFWGSSIDSTGHVGMCIGGGLMIHSNWNGVEICSIYYSSGTFVGGGPIV